MEPEQTAVAKKRARARVARRVALGVGSAGAVALVVWAMRPKPLPVELAPVTRGAMVVTVNEDGTTRIKDRYVVSAPLLANVARIELSPGDAVKKGLVLARLLPIEAPLLDTRSRSGAESRVLAASAAERQAHTGIERAKVALELAQKDHERVLALAQKNAIPAVEVERSEYALRSRREDVASAQLGATVADHELEVASSALRRTTAAKTAKPGAPSGGEQFEVTSPSDGLVLRVLHKEGVAQPGAPLLEVGDPAALEIVVDILTADAVHVRPGAKVRLERWGGENALAGHVKSVEPSAFVKLSAMGVEESRVNAVIDLDEPRERWRGLGDGYRLEARIVVWDTADCVKAPEGALFRRDDGWATFVVKAGVAELRRVKLGRRNGDVAEVVEGLTEGDTVVLHPSEKVTEGARVVGY